MAIEATTPTDATAATRINWLAVGLLTVAHQVIPAAWYGAFAQPWMKGWGKVEADFQNGSPIPYVYSLIGAIVLNAALGWLFGKLGVKSAGAGAAMAAGLWLVFVFHELLLHYSFALLPFSLVLIDSGVVLVCLLLSGAALGAWRRSPAR